MASTLRLTVFLTGRVAVTTDGAAIDEAQLGGRQGRLLFAYLVAERSRPVPRDELAEALWGETPPATRDKALTVIASKLRGALADAGLDGRELLTAAFGCYRLDLPEGTWVDLFAAASSAQDAEEALAAGELDQARAAAESAESLARRPFLPGEDGTWVVQKRRDLADIRERALSVLADACLRSGAAREAAKWAEELIALSPFREAGYRRLMEAHVVAGNRAEALRVYEQCRQLLAEELGAYPSPETDSIYRALLEAPQTSVRTTPVAEPTVEPGTSELSRAQTEALPLRAEQVLERRSRKRRAVLLSSLAGVIAAAVVVPLVVFGNGGSEGRSAVSAAGDSLGVFDARSGRLVAHIGVGATPTAVAAGEGAYWVTNADGHTVSRIDPGTNAVVDTIPVGNGPSGIATGAGAVWVVNSLDGTVSRIDPGTNTGRRHDHRRGRAARDRLRGRLGLGREHRRRNDHAGSTPRAAGGPRRSRSPRPSSPSAQARCGRASVPRARWFASIRRPGSRSARPRSGTARRGSPSAMARRGWRTAWTGRSTGSIPTRTPSPRS